MLDADVVMSEFLARNATGLLDYNDDDSDSIEIHNRGPSARGRWGRRILRAEQYWPDPLASQCAKNVQGYLAFEKIRQERLHRTVTGPRQGLV